MIAAAVWATIFALMAVWLAVYLYLTREDRPSLPRRPAPPTVADAQTSAGAGRNPAESGLPADKRMAPPAATAPLDYSRDSTSWRLTVADVLRGAQ